MKNKILILLSAVLLSVLLLVAKKETWSEGDPAFEHVYYFGFENWADFKNSVKYTVNQGETISIPVQFHSERIRSYDVETYYYVAGSAVLGVDYAIVDVNGSPLTPDDKGAFSIIWPQAKKGVQQIYVKGLNGSTGSFLLQTFNPNAEEGISVTNTMNNSTVDYEVHAFTQNYKVTVTIK